MGNSTFISSITQKIFFLSLIVIALGIGLLSTPHHQPQTAPSSPVLPPTEKDIQYQSHSLEHSLVHSLLIPAGNRFLVTPALSQRVSTLESFAQQQKVLAVINGGFFDPQNQKSTSIVIQQGVMVADPQDNARLINNPKLAPLLAKILDRTEFRRYRCNLTIRYDITVHSQPTPPGCQLIDALGGGPSLLPELTLIEEGFLDKANGRVIRDPLGSNQPNARSAVGITHDGDILWVMVAQKPESPTNSGMSLISLATFMKTFGVEKAMNLDGGSSSCLYYKGKTFYGKVDEKGNALKRNVLSVLLVRENKP
ncbi:MAG TPA: hypothetical protein DCL61_27450 [Cyanobacteria bacterium UBA12227]|nr:hypothetical protein [Cyanobacteria bacterium UBA12227]HAX88352.1 hypothetical protein [Cyanobacteria bacterium UBA11370]HBY80206.1 hypothetical protein [Cyanobacteria bacterium UBA11148]